LDEKFSFVIIIISSFVKVLLFRKGKSNAISVFLYPFDSVPVTYLSLPDFRCSTMGSMATPTYALPKSHQDVRIDNTLYQATPLLHVTILTHKQIMEKSLVETDPEVAEIMV
jgi:hypothetical protein